MTRLTRHDATLVVRDLQAAIGRLTSMVDAKPGGRSVAAFEAHRRQLANGTRHEMETLERLAGLLADGLQVTHAAPELAGPTDTTAAALAAALPKASGNRAKIVEALTCRLSDGSVSRDWGWTDVILASKTGLSPNTIRPRRGELVAQGWVEDSGERRDHHGRPHIVWRLTDAARERLQIGDTET